MSAIKTLPAPELCFAVPVDDKWQRERRAFFRMLPDLLVTYRDQFIAIHEEQVVASANSVTTDAEILAGCHALQLQPTTDN